MIRNEKIRLQELARHILDALGEPPPHTSCERCELFGESNFCQYYKATVPTEAIKKGCINQVAPIPF